MENITHSLVGLLVGEAAVQVRKKRGEEVSKRVRVTMWVTSWLANNLPDIDFIYTSITGGKLGYLLHHRGHTHTAMSIPLQVLCLLLPLWILHRWKGKVFSRQDFLWLTGVSAVGIAIHIFLDSLNSYGVHPWWPFNNAWVYGDSVFIVEPWFWVSLLPLLIIAAENRKLKWGLGFIWAAGIALIWLTGLVPKSMAALVTVWGFGLYFILTKLEPMKRVSASTFAFLFPLIVFCITSASVKREVAALYNQDSVWTLSDSVINPLPSNPFCWSVLTVAQNEDSYRIRRGVVAAMPSFFSSNDCKPLRGTASTSGMVAIRETPTKKIRWYGEYLASAKKLNELYNLNCYVSDFLKFSRAPYYREYPDSILVGDIRYDHTEELDFAEFSVPRNPDACPKFVPNWEPPRREITQKNNEIVRRR